jgi:bifunctional DNA-binding transcriptional regulator/antitoxin component of YhaV-PrlF toxin-antitoxin module
MVVGMKRNSWHDLHQDHKIGKSMIIIPSEIIKALALDEGDEVELNYDPISQILSSKFPNSKQLKLVPSGSDLEGRAQHEGKVRP